MPTPAHRAAAGTAFAASAVLVVACLIYGFFALIAMAGQPDQIPHGSGETSVWFGMPLGALAAASWSLVAAGSAYTRGSTLWRWALGAGLSLALGAGGVAFADSITN